MSDQSHSIEELEVAISFGDESKISELVDSFDPSKVDEIKQIEFLEALKIGRYFYELDSASSTLLETGNNSSKIKKLASQAKIEIGDLEHAENLLSSENIKLDWSHNEKSEIVGLLGRLNKQKYVSTSQTNYLAQSINYYDQGWQNKTNDYRWHGINSIALRARLDRDSSSNKNKSIIERMSKQILDDIKKIEKKGAAQVWDYATAMEASLAISDYDGMIQWAKKYSTNENVGAFQLAGTIRQLDEIWQIGMDPNAKHLMPVLQYELLNRPGSSVPVESVEFYNGQGFEAFYGTNGTQTMRWFKTLINKGASVVRIKNKASGMGVGTGFLINSSDFFKDHQNKLLLITNSHVVCDDGSEENALHPDKAEVEFTEHDLKPVYNVGSKITSSHRTKLDFWISEINCPENIEALSLSFLNPAIPLDAKFKERIYVVGYPRGGNLSVSMHGNALVGYDLPHVHYKSPTDKGCSGGPAMNEDLDCFAIHHRSRDDLLVNQGILLSEIKSYLN